jgi:hypothetical protein
MSRACRTGVLLIVVALAPPERATALGLLEWLDRLSGPGPFVIAGAAIPVGCYGVPNPTPGEAVPDVATDAARRPPAAAAFMPFARGLDCRFADRNELRVYFAAEIGRAWSNENNLAYLPPRSHHEKAVDAWTGVFTADVALNRLLSVGAGLGVIRFSPRNVPTLFEAFSKPVIQPFRFTVKPLVAFAGLSAADVARAGRAPGEQGAAALRDALIRLEQRRRNLELVQVRLTLTSYGKLTDQDFGGAPDSFRDVGELTWKVSLYVDVSRLFWHH